MRLEKKGIRAFGVAESFKLGEQRKSTLAGVVMRSDLIVDGFIFGSATISGDDATENIISMFYGLNRNDINVIMLRGAVISLFNIIDIEALHIKTDLPVVSVTFEKSSGLEPHLKHHFPDSWRKKMEMYRKIKGREEIRLKTGHEVFVGASGLAVDEVKGVLDKFTVQGGVPEPLRLAQLLAKAKLEWDLKGTV